MDGEPRRRGRLAEEPHQLDATYPDRADLGDRDAATIELLREEVGRVAQAAARDELTTGVASRARRQLDVGPGVVGVGVVGAGVVGVGVVGVDVVGVDGVGRRVRVCDLENQSEAQTPAGNSG